MNIEQYRAIKAEEAKASQEGTEPIDQVQAESTENQTNHAIQKDESQVDTKVETKPDEAKAELPDKITIEGVGEVSIDELKNGYLRQADYTRKTQEVSRKSKEVEEAVTLFEQLKQNPQYAQQLLQTDQLPESIDPVVGKFQELENMLYDMKLENEIEKLSTKYEDFDAREVLEIAHEKQITNLEDAYRLSKSYTNKTQPQNLEEMKEKIRQELLSELANEKKSTSTIISDGVATPVQDNSPSLSQSEHRIATMMGMSDKEYVKWRDADKK